MAAACNKSHLTKRTAHHLRSPPPQLIRPPVRELREQVVYGLVVLLALEPAEHGADAGTCHVCLRSCTKDLSQTTDFDIFATQGGWEACDHLPMRHWLHVEEVARRHNNRGKATRC